MKKIVLPLIALIFLGSLVLVSMLGLRIRYSYKQWIDPTNCEFIEDGSDDYFIAVTETKNADGTVDREKIIYVKLDDDGSMSQDPAKPMYKGQSIQLKWLVYAEMIDIDSKQPIIDETTGEVKRNFDTTPGRSAVTLEIDKNSIGAVSFETPVYKTKAKEQYAEDPENSAEEPQENAVPEEIVYILDKNSQLIMENAGTAGTLTTLKDMGAGDLVRVSVRAVGGGYESVTVKFFPESTWERVKERYKS